MQGFTVSNRNMKPVLDACCALRSFWFNQSDERAIFVDNRQEEVVLKWSDRKDVHRKIRPDIVADFTNLPFANDSFFLVVFDPPQIVRGSMLGNITKQNGCLSGDWRKMICGGFAECFRVLRPHGTLIFKWSEAQIPLREILTLTPEKPLFGHRSGAKSKTHWIAFLKTP